MKTHFHLNNVIISKSKEKSLLFIDVLYAEKKCRLTCNHLTPNDHLSGRTAPLTFRCCIFFIYSTNIRTEYFKHAAYPLFFLFKMPFIS